MKLHSNFFVLWAGFEAKYYLWGVFKRKQTSERRNNAACRDWSSSY